MSKPQSLFVASLGNPAPYAHTLHSAGHIVLDALAAHLGLAPFKSDATIWPGVSTSLPTATSSVTLWKCPTAMNISGSRVKPAWNQYLGSLTPAARESARLFIVHDEMELSLGRVGVKASGSARGHNGVRSVIQAFGGRNDAFSRIGIGIGRPPEGSREKGDVSAWVLRRLSGQEDRAIRGCVGEVCRILGVE